MVSRSTPADWISWIHAICKNRNVPFSLYTQINTLRLNLPGQEYRRGLDFRPNETQRVLERGTELPFLIWRLSWRHERSHHSVEQTEEWHFKRAHQGISGTSLRCIWHWPPSETQEYANSGSGWYYSTCISLALSSSISRQASLESLAHHSTAQHTNPDASQLCREAAQQERCLGDETLRDQCLGVQWVCQ